MLLDEVEFATHVRDPRNKVQTTRRFRAGDGLTISWFTDAVKMAYEGHEIYVPGGNVCWYTLLPPQPPVEVEQPAPLPKKRGRPRKTP